jgi:hypothetical protein
VIARTWLGLGACLRRRPGGRLAWLACARRDFGFRPCLAWHARWARRRLRAKRRTPTFRLLHRPGTLAATVNRDCAPWDGSAFTISIHYDPTTTITISIWQSTDINIPTTFTFPDATGQIGYTYILPELDPLQQLSGTIFFWRVEEGSPVEGRFEFVTEAGQQFEGQFKAEWDEQIAMCG